MEVALVYDRVNKWGGAERVLLALHELFPEAPLYTAVYSPEKASWAKTFPKVVPSFLQKIPVLNKQHELLGAFTPIAFEQFDFSEFNLVISVTSEAAKGIITKAPTKHICYCLTPTRYLWSGFRQYQKNPGGCLNKLPFYKQISRPILNYVKNWDYIAAQRPDRMVAISSAVKKRIKKYYDRESEVIYPPVEINKFQISNAKLQTNSKYQMPNYKQGDYYLIVSRLVPYKKVDLAVRAFNELGLPLVVVGTGSEEKKLKKIAKSNIVFTGHLTDEELAGYYKKSRAFIFPQEEDFGITAVEAQAAGTPVIAYKAGGALDTVIEGKTGVFFDRQTKKSLISVVKRFKKKKFNKKDLIDNAKRFSKERFKREFFLIVDQLTKNKNI